MNDFQHSANDKASMFKDIREQYSTFMVIFRN